MEKILSSSVALDCNLKQGVELFSPIGAIECSTMIGFQSLSPTSILTSQPTIWSQEATVAGALTVSSRVGLQLYHLSHERTGPRELCGTLSLNN